MGKARFSIAGLMGVVLVAAVGLAALKNASETWAGVMLLLTCGLLGLSVVGALYGGRAGRTWWLGFCVFGGTYMALSRCWSSSDLPWLPTTDLLKHLVPPTGVALRKVVNPFCGNTNFIRDELSPEQIAQCLWTLLAALLGALLARSFFAPPSGRTERRESDAGPTNQSPRDPWLRPTVAGMAVLIPLTSIATIGSRSNVAFWAGAALLFDLCAHRSGHPRRGFPAGETTGHLAGGRPLWRGLPDTRTGSSCGVAVRDGPVIRRFPPVARSHRQDHQSRERARPRSAGPADPHAVPQRDSTGRPDEIHRRGDIDADRARHPDLRRPHRPPGGRTLPRLDRADRPRGRPAEDDPTPQLEPARTRLCLRGRLLADHLRGPSQIAGHRGPLPDCRPLPAGAVGGRVRGDCGPAGGRTRAATRPHRPSARDFGEGSVCVIFASRWPR